MTELTDAMRVTPEEVRKLLRYEPETGKLFWLRRPAESGKNANVWNARYAGKEALCSTDTHGYCAGSIFDKAYRAHRVIWALVTEEWPAGQIDHIDGNRQNNAWANLRCATISQNAHNQKNRKDNTSGFKGVTWSKAANKWEARIKSNGKRTHLGTFASIEDAASAYAAASAEIHGEFGRTA